ncbi:flagellar hook-associated protein FlgL [Endozoicomonadaceae bacterium StTr2]
MRISTQQVHSSMMDALQSASNTVHKTQLQLASRKKMVEMSDDPRAASQLIGVKDQLAALEQYSDNIKTAKSMAEFEETQLTDMDKVLNRARELTIQAGSDALSPKDKKALATELDSLTEQLASLANTKSQSGEYIFAGTKGDQKPMVKNEDTGQWEYKGNSDVRKLDVSSSQTVKLGDTADSILGNVLNDLGKLSAGLKGEGELDTKQALKDIDKSLSSLGQTLTGVGTRIKSLDRAEATNGDVKTVTESQREQLEDLDFIEATTRYTKEVTALQASQKSYAMVSKLSLFDYI